MNRNDLINRLQLNNRNYWLINEAKIFIDPEIEKRFCSIEGNGRYGVETIYSIFITNNKVTKVNYSYGGNVVKPTYEQVNDVSPNSILYLDGLDPIDVCMLVESIIEVSEKE